MTDRKAKQTPLPDLLDQVPEDIVLGISGDEPVFPSYTNIPIGRLARQAAAELRRLSAIEAQRDMLLEALRWIDQRCPRSIMKHPPHLIHQEMAHDAGVRARAAIKAVEGEKT